MTYSQPGVFSPSVVELIDLKGIVSCWADTGCYIPCYSCGGDDEFFGVLGPTITVSVPEPSTWALLLLGFCGLRFMAYCRRRDLDIGNRLMCDRKKGSKAARC